MTTPSPIACLIDPQREFTYWGSGIRAPRERDHQQDRRQPNEWICFLVTDGEINLIDEIDGVAEQIQVPAGWIHIVPPRTWQRSAIPFPVGSSFLWWHFCSDDHWQWCQHDTALQLIDQQLELGKQQQWLIPRHCNLNHCLGEFRSLHQELAEIGERWGALDHGAAAINKHLMYRLHQECVGALVTTQEPLGGQSETRHARRVQWLLREHFQKFDSLADVAAELDLNPAYLARCCKRILKASVGDLIIEHRLRAAQGLLRSDNQSLKEISYSCGFSSLNYFCRRFKQKTGLSPGEWRKRHS